MSKTQHAPQATVDWRNLDAGTTIPTPGMKYCDQPYPVRLPDDTWLCMLTVGTLGENAQGTQNYTAVTISRDEGQTWSTFAPCNAPSYAVPLVTPYGRIYALTPSCFTYSDDLGKTWSNPYTIPAYPEEWSGWSVGMPLVHGSLAFLPWARISLPNPPRRTEVYFHRSHNLLTERDPEKVHWRRLPGAGNGLRGPDWARPEHRSEEPHIVALTDGTLYTVFRTDQGYIGYATSRDSGDTWSTPKPLSYHPDGGRVIKHPLACPSLWDCGQGRYLLFFHNHSGTTYADRNPAWISGGLEVDGEIKWSEPEILLYSDDLTYDIGRISYPGLLQRNNKYWIFETQKTLTRLHEIPGTLFEGTWQPESEARITTDGLVLSLAAASGIPAETPSPALPPFRKPWSNEDQRQGFSLDLWLNPGASAVTQRLLDNRTHTGRGFCLQLTGDGGLELILNDGQTENRWTCGPGLLGSDRPQHVAVIVDGGPKVITCVINAQLWDGGSGHQHGWGRFSPNLKTVDGGSTLRIAPDAGSLPAMSAVKVYSRALSTSEAVANFRAEWKERTR